MAASDFYSKISVEERDDWRKHHVTQLALKMLHEFRANAARDVLEASPSRPPTETSDDIGFHRGVKECIELLENEK